MTRPQAYRRDSKRPRVLTRARARKADHPTLRDIQGGALSTLEEASVTDKSRDIYKGHARMFWAWATWHMVDFSTAPELDLVLVMFMHQLFLDGYNVATGRTATSAIRYFLPLILPGKTPLPRTQRALDGWRKLCPPQMRLPIPLVAAAAIAGVLMGTGRPDMAAFVMIAFDTYLRPDECMRLRRRNIVPPVVGGNAPHHQWGLIVNDAEAGVPGKTGAQDESVMVDTTEISWVLAAMKSTGGPDDPLWVFTVAELRDSFRDALEKLGLGGLHYSLHSLRHGGASHDLLTKRRDLIHTRERGRWLCDASLRRYGKQTRLQDQINKMPLLTRLFGEQVWSQFTKLLITVGEGKPFPLALPAVEPVKQKRAQKAPTITRRWKIT